MDLRETIYENQKSLACPAWAILKKVSTESNAPHLRNSATPILKIYLTKPGLENTDFSSLKGMRETT